MDTLYLRLSFFIILGITRGINCNASKITIRHEAEDVDFNITSFDRKVFSSTPVWSIVSGSNENLIFDYEGDIKLNGSMYEDLKKKAILFKDKNCNENCWEVVYGLGTKRKFIKPDKKNSLSDDVFDREPRIFKSIPIDASAFPNNYNISLRRLRLLSDDRVETFYAKLLIVIDHVLFKKLGSNVEYVKKYMSIFWSSVDLQYRNISSPNIEIRITGILIGKDNKTLSYIDKYSPDGNSVNIERVLRNSPGIKNIIIKNTNLTNFDAIVTMTGFNGFIEGTHQVRIGSNGNGRRYSWSTFKCTQ